MEGRREGQMDGMHGWVVEWMDGWSKVGRE
jgi:hypothetical protein